MENCCNKKVKHKDGRIQVFTPYPKRRNKLEKWLNRYNHIMELWRTITATLVLLLQIIILCKIL